MIRVTKDEEVTHIFLNGYLCIDDLYEKINSLPYGQVVRNYNTGKRYVNISLYTNDEIKDVFGSLFSHTLFIGKNGVKALIADMAEFRKPREGEEDPFKKKGCVHIMDEPRKRKKKAPKKENTKKQEKEPKKRKVDLKDLPFE